MDLSDAYGSATRLSSLKEINRDDSLVRDLAPYFHATLSSMPIIYGVVKRVEVIGVDETRIVRHESQEGFGQGSPESTLGFTQVIQPDIVIMREILRKHAGETAFCSDDGFVNGPNEVIFPAVWEFFERLELRTALRPNLLKQQVTSNNMPKLLKYLKENPQYQCCQIGRVDSIPEEDISTLKYGDGVGIKVVNIPLGDDKYTKAIMAKKASKIERDLKNVTRLLSNGPADLQLAEALIVWCHKPRLWYWMQNVPPALMTECTRRVDKAILAAMSRITLQRFDDMNEDNVTMRRIRLPRRMHGAGIRSMEANSKNAFVATMIKCFSSLKDRYNVTLGVEIPGFNPVLYKYLCQPKKKRRNSSDNSDNSESSGSDESDESDEEDEKEQEKKQISVRNSVDGRSRLMSIAKAEFISLKIGAGNPTTGILSEDPETVWGTVLAKPQSILTYQVEEAERIRLESDFKALDVADPRRIAWMNATNYTSSFIPSFATGKEERGVIMNEELRTMWGIWLGLEIPSLREHKGKRIGSKEIPLDTEGMALLSANLTGDGWRTRHDKLKIFEYILLDRANKGSKDINPTCEAYDCFARFISTIIPGNEGDGENNGDGANGNGGNDNNNNNNNNNDIDNENEDGLTGLQRWQQLNRRKKQGMVPDLKWSNLKIKGTGDNGLALGEVKTLNAGKAYMKTPNEHRAAVKERARKIPKQYLKKAKDIDFKYNNGNPCVENELKKYRSIQSFVFGSFGEWSDDVDVFLEAVCSIIAANEWKELGYQQEKYYKSVLMSNVKSELAVLSLRTVAKLMSDRFSNISTNLKDGKDSMKHDIYKYHQENKHRAEMIREQNSINPNGATFLRYNRLIGY